ncbi:nucleotide exchange factor GrpE [Sphingosinicella sp.]|jgi:molecular chaperone GrpE|uniref:nucleotide exchange factor GrpE n=1 Tax=Sphingosinicella sp. TaxID=1917971 RepID=UPI00181C536A|nr:nucleotide exchange factor GrpE [Sphingosinicella sp.]MBA4759806.1 nucleotide exchange factor GrpE [Sphingosinicella sp.]
MIEDNEKLTPEEIAAAEQPVEVPEADPLAEKDAEIADLKDRLLRAVAESENVRRRLEREKADAVAYAVTGFARDLLGVADNLRRALDAAAKDDVVASPLLSGVEITEKELLKAFEKHGIARVESVGQKLDPNRHQAMLEVVQEGAEPGQIVAELQTGYVLKDRLLRPAMVTVAKEA